MIGRLRVGDVGGGGPGHMARGAIGLLDVMFRGEGIAMAGEAFGAIVGDALFRWRRGMRIVTAGAGHLVA